VRGTPLDRAPLQSSCCEIRLSWPPEFSFARPNNPAQASALEKWLTDVVRSFAERILPIDQAVADEWGRVSAKRSLSTIDALLAATAKVNGMTLATRNISDVVNLGVPVVNPFDRRT